jgi:hypothetical protein
MERSSTDNSHALKTKTTATSVRPLHEVASIFARRIGGCSKNAFGLPIESRDVNFSRQMLMIVVTVANDRQ